MEENSRDNRRRSSILFTFEPNSERGAFIQFMEESGANSILIDALKALYDCPEKPDTPIQWLANYFRKTARRRPNYIRHTKDLIRKKLIDLESLILHMKDEEVQKNEKLRNLRNVMEDDVGSSSLPDEKEIEENPQVRIDTRWKISPDPFFKATCSQEELFLLKKSTKHDDRGVSGSTNDDELDETALYDEHLFQKNGHFINTLTNLDDDLDEEEEEEWINAYNVYKETSQLPKTQSEITQSKGQETNEEEEEEETGAEVKVERKSKVDIVDPKDDKEKTTPIHPESLPKNYWIPGYTLENHTMRDENEINSSSDESETGDEMKGDTESSNYYRPSKGAYRLIKRPQRSNIIYENMWELWQTNLPGKDLPESYFNRDIPGQSRVSTTKATINHPQDLEESREPMSHELPTVSSTRAHIGDNDRNVISDF